MGGEDTTTTDTDQEVIIVTRGDREIYEDRVLRDRVLRERERVIIDPRDPDLISGRKIDQIPVERVYYLWIVLIILIILGYYFYTRSE